MGESDKGRDGPPRPTGHCPLDAAPPPHLHTPSYHHLSPIKPSPNEIWSCHFPSPLLHYVVHVQVFLTSITRYISMRKCLQKKLKLTRRKLVIGFENHFLLFEISIMWRKASVLWVQWPLLFVLFLTEYFFPKS